MTITEYHTKEVEIGGEKIEAEFFETDYSSSFSEVWSSSLSMWDKITMPFHRLKHKVRNLFWNIRYGFERMFKGYDSVDTFEIFDTFIDRYQKILTEYKKYHWGYPANLTEEEWENIIDEMLYHLHFMKEDNIDKELDDYDIPLSWILSHKTMDEVREKHKDKFFELFSKHFYNLWD